MPSFQKFFLVNYHGHKNHHFRLVCGLLLLYPTNIRGTKIKTSVVKVKSYYRFLLFFAVIYVHKTLHIIRGYQNYNFGPFNANACFLNVH